MIKLSQTQLQGILTTGISDHLIQFLIEPSIFSKNNYNAIPHVIVLSISIKKNLKNEIINIDWEDPLVLKKNDIDYFMDVFLHVLKEKN